ncbi:MAG: 1-acyl-sn-glycerol-3-phosphate acyltransferase [Clostridia bacterium]|nr:1-acyl-sn-glycerol-3-phosphate acyltransferase [Clostridia bacterium]
MTLYDKLKKRLGWLFRHIYRLEVVGAENVPEDGGFILSSNHTALFDPIVLILSVPRRVHFMAKKESFKTPVIGKLMAKVGMFPVNRGTVDVKAIKTALGYLNDGEVIGIFPQGTRMPGVDPKETKAKEGVAMIAYHTGCRVVPAFIKTKKRKLKMFSKATVIIGKPIEPEELHIEKGTPSEYEKATKRIFGDICALEDSV